MLKLTLPLFALCISVVFISCKKETSPNTQPANIQGNYKFVSKTVDTRLIDEVSSSSHVSKAISIDKYTSIDNSGTIKFDTTSMTSKNFAYGADFIEMGYFYTNGVLFDSLRVGLQLIISAKDFIVPYKVVGTDSIYFSTGTAFTEGDPAGQRYNTPSGAKLKIQGDKIYITFKIKREESTQNGQGMKVYQSDESTNVLTFQKQ